MPYPAQISPERILEKAAEILEAEGAEQLSLHRLAAALGVKAPSLYRYFTGKTDLLRALNLHTVQKLIASLHAVAAAQGDARTQMLEMAQAWRSFSIAHPRLYALAFAHPDPELRPDPQLLEALAVPLQEVIAGISGLGRSLDALRGLWALLHGFVLLEASGQFRRGGDLETAFTHAVEAYLEGWG